MFSGSNKFQGLQSQNTNVRMKRKTFSFYWNVQLISTKIHKKRDLSCFTTELIKVDWFLLKRVWFIRCYHSALRTLNRNRCYWMVKLFYFTFVKHYLLVLFNYFSVLLSPMCKSSTYADCHTAECIHEGYSRFECYVYNLCLQWFWSQFDKSHQD